MPTFDAREKQLWAEHSFRFKSSRFAFLEDPPERCGSRPVRPLLRVKGKHHLPTNFGVRRTVVKYNLRAIRRYCSYIAVILFSTPWCGRSGANNSLPWNYNNSNMGIAERALRKRMVLHAQ